MDTDDQSERMDLVLNSELCSVLLDCWDEATNLDTGHRGSSTGSRSPSHSERNRMWEAGSNDGHQVVVSDLPSFLMDDSDFTSSAAAMPQKMSQFASSNTGAMYESSSTIPHTPSLTNTSVSTASAAQAKSSASSSTSSSLQQSAPVNIVSEAISTKLHPQGITSSADCPPHVAALNAAGGASTFLPLAFSAPPGTAPTTANLLMLQQQFALAKQQQQQQEVSRQSTAQPLATVGTHDTRKPPPIQQQRQVIYDAPMELRANFLQSQIAHGLPVLQDHNSYHCGMAVNGFHPETSNVKFEDVREGDPVSKRAKNAKEQKRAQQITNLIEQLRIKMEKDGWKAELKSKFHTLSS
jgi:hypothetical protein